MRKLAILGLAGLLSACGTVSPLTPPEGATLPDAPYGAPDKPSAPDTPNRDWTEVKKKETVEEPPEPPKEPIYKQLLEFIQSMWRASGSAIEIAQDVSKMTLQERMAQQVKNEPLTYSDPKVKRTGGL